MQKQAGQTRQAGEACGAPRKALRLTAVALFVALAAGTARPAAQPQQGQPSPAPPDGRRFDISVSLTVVSVDVVVRDASGNVVRGLTANDFAVSEDGKPQKIDTFSFQEIAATAPGASE